MVRFIVSLVLLVASMVGPIILEGGNILAYIGISAFIIDASVPFFAMLAVWRIGQIGTAWKDAFSKRGGSSSAVRSQRIWEFAEKVCYATGVVGFLAGMVIIFSNWGAPLNTIGRPLAAGMLGPIYAVLFAILCRILRARVQE
jgi:flagellar motor component MotA